MAGIQIIAKDKNGNIKQDYELERTATSGKIIRVNELKDKQKIAENNKPVESKETAKVEDKSKTKKKK